MHMNEWKRFAKSMRQFWTNLHDELERAAEHGLPVPDAQAMEWTASIAEAEARAGRDIHFVEIPEFDPDETPHLWLVVGDRQFLIDGRTVQADDWT